MNIAKKLEQSITVEELIDALQDHDPEARVVFASNYGDHTHTQQVHLIKGEINKCAVRESAYSESRLAIDENDDPDDDEQMETVLVIE